MFRSLTFLATSTAVAAATIEAQCQNELQALQRQSLSDDELAIRCRAGFSPKVCKAFREAVGPQPWSDERVGDSCTRFAALAGSEDREMLLSPATLDRIAAHKETVTNTLAAHKETVTNTLTSAFQPVSDMASTVHSTVTNGVQPAYDALSTAHATVSNGLDASTLGKATTTAAAQPDETTKEEVPSDDNATAAVVASPDQVSVLAALPVKPTTTNSVGLYAKAAAPLGLAMIAMAAFVARRRRSALTPEALEERASLQEETE